jgi:hypothetical protein
MAKKPSGGGGARPPQRHTTPKEASLASNVLAGRVKPTTAQVKSLAASVLSQDAPKRK